MIAKLRNFAWTVEGALFDLGCGREMEIPQFRNHAISQFFLGMFNDHALDDIRYILTAVYCGFQFLVDLFPFEYGQGVV